MIVMTDEKLDISVSSANSVLPTDSGTITKLEQEETVTIKRATNHNELSMMESNWLQIKRKINLISLQKRIDVNAILIGAAIPYAIDIITDYIAGKTPNYFPFFICVLLMVACKFLAKIIPYLSEDISAINKVHLDDLQNLVEQVEKSQLPENN